MRNVEKYELLSIKSSIKSSGRLETPMYTTSEIETLGLMIRNVILNESEKYKGALQQMERESNRYRDVLIRQLRYSKISFDQFSEEIRKLDLGKKQDINILMSRLQTSLLEMAEANIVLRIIYDEAA